MLAGQLLAAAAGARNSTALDETARLLWRALAEAQIPGAEAGAISEAIEARRAALAGKRTRPALGCPNGCAPKGWTVSSSRRRSSSPLHKIESYSIFSFESVEILMSDIKLSICIPTYNRALFLEQKPRAACFLDLALPA
jgi:hypothetical protein